MSGRFWMSRTAASPLSAVDVGVPLALVAVLDLRHELLERLLEIADQADVDADVLVDLGRVDVDVDLLGVEGVGLEVARDAIVEAHAEGEEQVGFLDRGVDPGFAVHAHHAEVERMRGGEGADAEQRRRDRDVGALGELADDVAGARDRDAVPGQDHRRFAEWIRSSACWISRATGRCAGR